MTKTTLPDGTTVLVNEAGAVQCFLRTATSRPTLTAKELVRRARDLKERTKVQRVVPVNVTNVQDYLTERFGIGADLNVLFEEQMPGARSPWDVGMLSVGPQGKLGHIVIVTQEVPVDVDRCRLFDSVMGGGLFRSARLPRLAAGANSLLLGAVYHHLDSSKPLYRFAGHFVYPIDARGDKAGEVGSYFACSCSDCKTEVIEATAVTAMAFSLANCRNVKLGPPQQSSRAQWKQVPGLRFSEIIVHSVRTFSGGPSKTDAEPVMPTHIIRGHFKDYRQSGLFGQHHGVYWWDQAVRGKGLGTVVKSYDVQP